MATAQRTGYTFETSIYAFRGGGSRKFWIIMRRGSTVITWWGRLNTPGQTLVKSFRGDGPAESYWWKKIEEKEGKGYAHERSLNVGIPEIYALIIGDGDARQLVGAADLIQALVDELGYDPRPTF